MIMTSRMREELELIEIILTGKETDSEKVQEALQVLQRVLK